MFARVRYECTGDEHACCGNLKPKEAYEYLFSLPNIESVVVGVSTKEHAEETFGIIRRYGGGT